MKGTGTTTLLEFYPNPLGITPDMRAKFHPVVKINQDCVSVLDLSQESGQSHLIPKEDQESFIQNRNREERFNQSKQENCYTIGKYDENRVKLYSSELFQDSLNSISGYDGARTLHVGVDLGGPVGENVHSFWDGVVHSVGYNSELGDYGYVVIVEYDLSEVKWNLKQDENHPESDCGIHDETRQCGDEDTRNTSDGSSSGVVSCQSADCNRFWALYGHLDASTMDLNTVGKRIQRGDVLGHIGDVHENGGW
jgi:murein DD-endopeptidase MepM/ murein hydrolase activator NlpD